MTTQDYATVATIYRMIERREASKIMVFCSRNDGVVDAWLFFKFLCVSASTMPSIVVTKRSSTLERGEICSYLHVVGNKWHDETHERECENEPLYEFRMGKTQVLFNVDCEHGHRYPVHGCCSVGVSTHNKHMCIAEVGTGAEV